MKSVTQMTKEELIEELLSQEKEPRRSKVKSLYPAFSIGELRSHVRDLRKSQ